MDGRDGFHPDLTPTNAEHIDGVREVCIATAPGDYVFVPPYVPHREENPDPDNPAVIVIARSTQEAIVVNLPELYPISVKRATGSR